MVKFFEFLEWLLLQKQQAKSPDNTKHLKFLQYQQELYCDACGALIIAIAERPQHWSDINQAIAEHKCEKDKFIEELKKVLEQIEHDPKLRERAEEYQRKYGTLDADELNRLIGGFFLLKKGDQLPKTESKPKPPRNLEMTF